MRNVPLVVLPAVAGLVLLAGCAVEPAVDPRALHAWQDEQDADEERRDDVLGVLTAGVQRGHDDPGDAGSQITIEYPHPQTIEHLRFSCFGNGHMSGIVRTTSATGGGSEVVEDVACRDSPHRIDLPAAHRTDVERVSFAAYGSDRASEWRLVIVGDLAAG